MEKLCRLLRYLTNMLLIPILSLEPHMVPWHCPECSLSKEPKVTSIGVIPKEEQQQFYCQMIPHTLIDRAHIDWYLSAST